MDERALRALERADPDELLRVVDGYCAVRDWDSLWALRAHCRAAVERGKQLWGVEEHIRYRLALEAPAEHAGRVVTEGPARHTLGPLSEVAASTHSWTELDPYLGPGPDRALVAHERVVRGEDLPECDVDPDVLELPTVLQPWEPAYPVATYHPDRVDSPAPPTPPLQPAQLGVREDVVSFPRVEEAFFDLVSQWVEGSNGRFDLVGVKGSAADALAGLGVRRIFLAKIRSSSALAHMAWAAASGGAHGRRRGAAFGRFAAWWAVASLADVAWPPDPVELGAALKRLRWYVWSDGAVTGWALRLAVETPEGMAWAFSALDAQ